MEASVRLHPRIRARFAVLLVVLAQHLSLTDAFHSVPPSKAPPFSTFIGSRSSRIPPGRFSASPALSAVSHSTYVMAKSTTSRSRSALSIRASAKKKQQRRSNAPRGRGGSSSMEENWNRMIDDLIAFRSIHGHVLVTQQHANDNKRWSKLFVWSKSVRRNYAHQALESRSRRTTASSSSSSNTSTRRRRLSANKLQQLQELDFCWDVQAESWERRYNQLQRFYREYGHARVPANYPDGLGVFVRNCRREYRRLEQGEPSTLTVDRLNKLISVDFVWYKSREEAWEYRYRELQEFYQTHGHANVPENYPDNPALGNWCMNQRTYYKRRYRGELSSLTEERMQLLEDLGFVWNYRQFKFDSMLNRLSNHYLEHGHTQIATTDVKNQDLRYWITMQRYYYHHRQRDLADGVSAVPLTDERIQAIESAIPDFSWRARGGKTGPSSKDWANLFDAIREKGIRPGLPSKTHWFDGVNPFKDTVKHTWTEEDLMALWNAEEEYDDDGDGYNRAKG